MGIGAQLGHAIVHGPAAIARLRSRGWVLLAVYVAAAGAVLGFVGHEVVAHKDDILGFVAGIFFPERWRFTAARMFELFLSTQLRDVVVNAVIGVSLLVVQVLLFALKERVSAAFEREAHLTAEAGRELPLWQQALEELQLSFVYVTVQMSVFWLGYSPDPARKQAALAVSYLFLFASFGIDFLSPILQRHTFRYTTMFKVFARHPLAVLAFGAVFTLPVVAVGRVVTSHPEWTIATKVALLFGANLFMIAWAVVAGTWVGAQLLPAARATTPLHRSAQVAVAVIVLGAFGWNAYRFGVVGRAVHRKTGILKCDYAVSWTSLELDPPRLLDFMRDEVTVGVSALMSIRNPTRSDVELETNRLEVRHGGRVVAVARISPVQVPAGREITQRIAFPLTVAPSIVFEGRRLLDPAQWAATLFFEVAPGFDFPVYLR